ncbi:MAG: SURF1 family protein [Gammaproteobacteria bacterium]
MKVGRYDFRPSWWPSVLALFLLGLLIFLGLWQLERGAEKQRTVDEFALRTQDLPVRIDENWQSAEGLRFRSVSSEGRYDAGHQYLLDNRTYHGRAGYHVLTPLRISEETGVLVNRGWVTGGARREQLPEVAAPRGETIVQGMVAIPSQNAFLVGPAGYESGGWPRVVQRVELATMERQLGYSLLPYVVQLDAANPHGFVREWQPYVGISPERHRAYAFQWFSLALALVVIYFLVNTRRLARNDGEVKD